MRGTGRRKAHQYTHSYWLFISYSMQTKQPARKTTLLEKETEREWVLDFCLFVASVISQDMRFFNGFSHICVWGNMICIHLAVTGTAWGRGLMERLLMCKHNMIFLQQSPYFNPSCSLFHSCHSVRSNVPSSVQLQCILLLWIFFSSISIYRYYCIGFALEFWM